MRIIEKPHIKLKESLDQDDFILIHKLKEQCAQEDKTVLKLELDYKLGVGPDQGNSSAERNINEFMYFDGQHLIGYIGICCFGRPGAPMEANGMVHPEYRRQGVFKVLHEFVIAEWKRRETGTILLLSDRNSISGQKMIQGTGAKYHHSEYEMFLKKDNVEPVVNQLYGITLRKATQADTRELARQNSIYFGEIIEEEDITLPENEEASGVVDYLAEKDGQVVGKVRLQMVSGIGGIYGLGVLPEYRGRGLGRAILKMAVEKLKKAKSDEIMLQVETENTNALLLYKSCGFRETSTMDYFELER